MPYNLLGKVKTSILSQILGTDYKEFWSPLGLEGLAKTEGDRLDILFIKASRPGSGQFREFILIAQKQYKTIAVWEVWNKRFDKTLAGYGFEETEIIDSDGFPVKGRIWNAQ